MYVYVTNLFLMWVYCIYFSAVFNPTFSFLKLGLTVNHHADQSLNSFCQWQSGLVGKGGKRHDHAILLTGLDICSWKNEPCDTLGKAAFISALHKNHSDKDMKSLC